MQFDFVLLYVANPPESAKFYAELLGTRIIDSAPTFAMMPLREGVLLGLWQTGDVQPAVNAPNGGSEVAFKVDDAKELEARHKALTAKGLRIVQQPTDMDFGRTFVALDADGNRLRFYASNQR